MWIVVCNPAVINMLFVHKNVFPATTINDFLVSIDDQILFGYIVYYNFKISQYYIKLHL